MRSARYAVFGEDDRGFYLYDCAMQRPVTPCFNAKEPVEKMLRAIEAALSIMCTPYRKPKRTS